MSPGRGDRLGKMGQGEDCASPGGAHTALKRSKVCSLVTHSELKKAGVQRLSLQRPAHPFVLENIL